MSYQIVKTLQALGHEVPWQDASAPINFNFCQPWWFFDGSPEQYKIGMVAWESTELPDGWLEEMNTCDEIWTPSDLIADWFVSCGVKQPKVYKHGVDPEWQVTKLRERRGPLKFLQIGGPASRKNSQLAFDAFRTAFGDRNDVQLTIKAHGNSEVRVYKGESIIGVPHEICNNVNLITKDLSIKQMVQLYLQHDVLVYTSGAEGFGLIPFQGIATGMPVICPDAWAPYRKYILPDLRVSATMVESPWKKLHPGLVFQPDFEQLVERYQLAYSNFEQLSNVAFKQAPDLHKEYDWMKLTREAFEDLSLKFDES